ncbi:hypothetical protein [Streptomyces sp. WMMB303]|nr:hypothetical protein [Streptomyces sp. WMMB303]MDF4254563.1 hypothetical protein [Streptomyces sp. WMMB303]
MAEKPAKKPVPKDDVDRIEDLVEKIVRKSEKNALRALRGQKP